MVIDYESQSIYSLGNPIIPSEPSEYDYFIN
jgi:hypothetical protein